MKINCPIFQSIANAKFWHLDKKKNIQWYTKFNIIYNVLFCVPSILLIIYMLKFYNFRLDMSMIKKKREKKKFLY